MHFTETKGYKEALEKGIKIVEEVSNIAQLIPTKPDAELAEEFKQEVAKAYEPLIDVLNKYDKYGLNIQAGVGKNAFGKFQINQLTVIKQF